MNNKGFMMAEVVVVASIILVTMGSLYTSYNKIISIYNQRVNYYDITTLYELANYRDNYLSVGVGNTPILDNDGKKIYYVNLDIIKNNTLSVENQTFKDYLKYLSTSLDYDKLNDDGVDEILLMERCTNQDNCKYAYLEVFHV